ncbi:P-loop ATPase, Sll1717 family [Acinetobacter pittii]|uniref:KAP NTPase domain-containing protein n=1 Tax=Acinetobacter pittii ANC 4050 TaxID=1217691 RepID=R8YAU2_ACIPI|nr:hypothetical protein [Acinetobacter pittii]EOQ66231.1 hypothetical protein F931_03228 [Acinetobacter pittii ANC 4050]
MTKNITFAKDLRIGELDAEADSKLLDSCFIDNGYLEQLIDVKNPKSIILGRTGSGKSALLYKLEKSVSKCKRLDPHDISIKFLEHSDIINFFENLDIKLDLFYRMLWRHIIILELLKLRYDFNNSFSSQSSIFRNFLDWFKDNNEKKAYEYFQQWGDKFWLETDEQLKQITSKLESETKASLGANSQIIKAGAEGLSRYSEEQITDIKRKANQVIDGSQLANLNHILDTLNESAFNDPQKKFYLIIDQLDEDWANTSTRCRFIRALIEEIKSFRKLAQIKIVIALRKDLLQLVFDKTRDSGFQEEKYESYILDILWQPFDLRNLVEKRINQVFKFQYTNGNITFDDLFPSPRKKGGQLAFDFLIERTLRRPRDILQFVNTCFQKSSDNKISWRALLAAEAIYSSKRLNSLSEEWSQIYPSFLDIIEILRGKTANISRSTLAGESLQEVILTLYEYNETDSCIEICKKIMEPKSTIKESEIISQLLVALYKTGTIGIKISSLETFIWSYIDQPNITIGEAKRATSIKIHKMLHRALDIVLEQTDIYSNEDYI